MSEFRNRLRERHEACWVHGDNPFPFVKDAPLKQLIERFDLGGSLFNVNACKQVIQSEFTANVGYFGHRKDLSCIGGQSLELCHELRNLHKCQYNYLKQVNTSQRSQEDKVDGASGPEAAEAGGAQAR